MSSRLCSKVGILRCKAEFSRSTTVSFIVQDIVGKFFHPIWRVGGIATNSSSYPSEVKNSPSLGASVRRNPMCQNLSLKSALKTYMGPCATSAIMTSVMRRSRYQPCCMADMAAIGKFLEFNLL